ncbi:unnamed protein product [Microthlaspi erraticum]|uniref:Mediator of RNA polymerase II transcription subunit 9 n=1 Tax=Microthlaspi erraticum TaxID=1685480 RepID=A0A6D2KWQ2_9BRAS|nr:unnamed protein product [Microthlaspi erraticum]
MADALENLQEAQRRRSDETDSRSIEETNGRDSDSRVKIMNKNFAVGYYDQTESIQSRPEKRAKTVSDSRESLEDLEKGVDIPETLSVDVHDNLHERIEKQKRRAEDNMQQQSNDEREAQDQQNMEQQRDIERKGRDIRFRLDQLVEKLTDAIETGTKDQNSDALVTELSNHFNKSQQLLNSISGSLGSKSMTIDGEKRKLEGSEKLLQQRRELIMEYRKSVEDILKIEP